MKNVSIYYPPKRVSVTTQQYYSGSYIEETFHDITKKSGEEKNQQLLLINIQLRAPPI